MKAILSILCVFLLLFLSSCQMQPTSTSSAPFVQNELIQPTSSVFELTGVEAEIYDSAVSTLATSQYTCIPHLSVVGTYQDDTGNTCYICKCHVYIYDKAIDPPDLALGEEICWMRFVVDSSGICTQVLTSQNGDLWSESVKKLCGPCTDIANSIIENREPDHISHIPNLSPKDFLSFILG